LLIRSFTVFASNWFGMMICGSKVFWSECFAYQLITVQAFWRGGFSAIQTKKKSEN
jgi:hypothetical protein